MPDLPWAGIAVTALTAGLMIWANFRVRRGRRDRGHQG